ncbi:MAG: Gldg family protein [Gemmatimonadota bacterium]|nr:MAG: Gldg family protein [Gemmatimonadota bacterium]
MRNLWTIARKELRGYFDHPTAYILLVVFLGINLFFYFRGAFLVGEASLRPMFDLLPWILLLFVPAVTMGALAEERRHGTLEVALSHPISEYQFMLGKYVGNVLFIAIALAGTLLVPFTLLVGGAPDFGVIVAQYVGSLLLAAGMAAVGIFASALTRNQITAFIVGTAVIFALMLAGTEVVQIGIPALLARPLGELAILPRFANVARGVIDLRDVVYFASLAAAFLALGYWLLLRDRLSHGSRLYRNLRLGTLTIVAIAVVANLFGRYIPGRLDLTAERLYTVSGGTRAILRDLDDVVTITMFVSRDLPAQVRTLERDVSDVLRDFRRYGRGNIQVISKHPDRSDEAEREAQQLGIAPVQFNVVSREELQLKQGWLGLAVRYADEAEAIPFVADTRSLEYQLASQVWRLTRTQTPKVAFVTGHGERTQSEYAAFNRELGRTYEVSTVDLTAEDAELDSDLDAVIVAGPRRALDARSRALLRNYLARDGRALYLGDGVDVNLQFLFASAVADSARDFSEAFGIRVNDDLVYDLRSNEMITVPGQIFADTMAYPFWLRALPAEEHPVTGGLNSVFLPWASSLDTLATLGDREFTPLLTTSEFAWQQIGNFEIRPDAQLFYERESLRPQVLAYAIQNAVAGATVPVPAPPTSVAQEGDSAAIELADTVAAADTAVRIVDTEVFAGPPAGRVVVVGDADFLDDRFLRNAPENLVFALNAIDWLTQTEALLGIRSKSPTPRPLVFSSDVQKAGVKYINLIGVPLAFVIFGAFRMLRRRRQTRQVYGS